MIEKLKIFAGLFLATVLVVSGVFYVTEPAYSAPLFGAAPSFTFQPSLIPLSDSTFTLGTTSKAWLNIYTDRICLAGNCQSDWSAGAADGTFSTSSADYWDTTVWRWSTTSADYWETQQAARSGASSFSTTSADYWLTLNQGAAFSTTSADYWGGTKGYLTSHLWPFTPGTYYSQSVQSTTTALQLKASPFSLFASSTALFEQASTTNLTVTGQIFAANGSVSAPAFTFASEPDTGIYLNTTNTVALTGGGAGVSWNGSELYPNTSNARTLGIASTNIWNKLYVNAASTTDITTSNSLHLTQLTGYAPLVIDQNNKVVTAASSTWFGSGSNGQVLGWTNGVPGWVATSSGTSLSGGVNGMLAAWNDASTIVPTSTPQMANFYATSTTATSTLSGRLVIGTSTAPFFSNAPLVAYGDINSYAQIVLQNKAAGTGASAEYVVGGNNMLNNAYYGSFGCNSSANTDASYTAFLANDCWMYSKDSNLHLATASSTASRGDIVFSTGGTLLANQRARITAAGVVSINGTATTTVAKGLYADSIAARYFMATSSATSTFAGGINANTLNITSSSATSTFANGLILNTGCVYSVPLGRCIGITTTNGENMIITHFLINDGSSSEVRHPPIAMATTSSDIYALSTAVDYKNTSFTVFKSTNSGGTWTSIGGATSSATVYYQSPTANRPAIDVDKNGMPGVAWAGKRTGATTCTNMYFAYYTGTIWIVQQVSALAVAGYDIVSFDLKAAADGTWHLAWAAKSATSSSSARLNYASRTSGTSGTWSGVNPIGPPNWSAKQVKIITDKSAKPHVLYSGSASTYLIEVKNTSGTWVTSTSSIVTTQMGNPVIDSDGDIFLWDMYNGLITQVASTSAFAQYSADNISASDIAIDTGNNLYFVDQSSGYALSAVSSSGVGNYRIYAQKMNSDTLVWTNSIQNIYGNGGAYANGGIATYQPQSVPKFILQMPTGEIRMITLTGQ